MEHNKRLKLWTPCLLPSSKPTIVEVVYSLLGIFLPLELHIDIPHLILGRVKIKQALSHDYQVIAKVVANVHLLHLPILVLTLDEDVLEKVVVMLLHLLIGNIGQMAPVGGFGRVLRVDVEVLQQDGLRERRLVVDPRTSLTVGARASLNKKYF